MSLILSHRVEHLDRQICWPKSEIDAPKHNNGKKRTPRPARFTLGLAGVTAALILSAGCATKSAGTTAAPSATASTSGTSGETATETGTRMASDMARQPLRDIGMMKRTIPAALTRISDPYAEPSGPGCPWLDYEIAQLDAALGPEPVAAQTIDDRSMGEKSQEAAKTAAGQAVRGAAASLIPARGLVRFISGAEKADRAMREAKERGMVRRGYLRGLSKAQSCPATPSATTAAATPPPARR